MRLHPLLFPPMSPAARVHVGRALREARIGWSLARRYAVRGRADLAEWCAAQAEYLHSTARAIRAGALHDTAAHGWPYLVPQPQLPPVPDATHVPFPL